MTLGHDGRVWFANVNGGDVDSVDTAGNFATHNVGGSQQIDNFDVASGHDHIWFTSFNPSGTQGWVGHLADGKTTLYPLPFMPLYITPGLLDMWFGGGNHIDKISSGGTITSFTLDAKSNVEDLVRGPDGNIWFTDEFLSGATFVSKIGKITPAHGRVTEFVVPDTSPDIIGIAVGPDANLWFTDGNLIGKCTVGGAVTLYPIPTQTELTYSIAAGPSGDLYFTELDQMIGRVTFNPISITEFQVPFQGANPNDIVLGADDNMWFSIPDSGYIGRFNTH